MKSLRTVCSRQLLRVAAVGLLCAASAHEVLAQRPPCSRLPPAEREVARHEGRCVDPPATPQQVPKSSAVDTPKPQAACPDPPKFSSNTYDVAVKELDSQQFSPRRFEEASSRPRGSILRLSTERRQGRLCWVNFWVSDGSLTVVPPVKQLPLDAARRRLYDEERRLDAAVTEREDGAAPAVVLDQAPAAGVEVARGSTVKLVVSTGLPVPSVTGEPVDEAANLLARFTVERTEVESTEPLGRVLDQDPKPPARRAAGTRVALRISDGSRVTVPNVQSQTLAAARATLKSVGLAAAVERGPDRDDATVTWQDPPAAAPTRRGTVVRLQATPPPLNPLWYATGGAVLVAAAVLAWLMLKPAPTPPAPAPPVRVAGRLDSSPADTRIEAAAASGPTVRVKARLEPGVTEVHSSDGDQS